MPGVSLPRLAHALLRPPGICCCKPVPAC